MWIAPYVFALIALYFLRFAPLVVRYLVVRYEPNKEYRPWLEQACLFSAAVTALLSLFLSSWIVALAKAGEVLVRLRSDAAVSLFIGSVTMFGLTFYLLVRYVRGVTPHDFDTVHGGILGMTVKNTLRSLHGGGILLGLAVDFTARLIGNTTYPSH